MGHSVSLFLTRAAGIICGGMLLFAVMTGARAAEGETYGLKRFSGDNYEVAPQSSAPGGYTPAPAGPAPSYGYTPAPPVAQAPPMGPPPAMRVAATEQTPYGYKAATGAPAPLGVAAPAHPGQRMAAVNPNAYYASPSMGPTPDYVLGQGDKLRLTVFDEGDISGEYTIDGSGFVRLPLIGQVRAAGYSTPQLEAVIGSALAQGYLKSPRVSIQVSTYRPFYIIGAVTRPGEYPYVNHMNALNAVALAGGYAPSAKESTVYVRREGSNREIRMPADRSTQVYPGDVVRVDTTLFYDATNVFGPLSGPLGIAAAAALY